MLSIADQEAIVNFVRAEPRTVQDIAKHLTVSWVTAERYCTAISERTGQITIKTFRKGTQGALKLVYYRSSESASGDATRAGLWTQIRAARFKHHFDFLEIYQYARTDRKAARIVTDDRSAAREVLTHLASAQESVRIFSGNLSLIRLSDGKTKVLDMLETVLARNVRITIIARVSLGAERNLDLLEPLLVRYPKQLEIRHAYQPLRGIIVDGRIAHFKDEENSGAYKEGELPKNARITYDVMDEEWVAWLETVFWNLYRASIDSATRWRTVKALEGKQ